MKNKKLLLALPMVAVLASCSGKIEVYRDIFKDARGLSEEEKQEIIDGYEENRQYHYNGTRTIVTYMSGEEVGRSEAAVNVELSEDPENDGTGFTYKLDSEIKYSAYYDAADDQWAGNAPEGVSLEDLYYKFRNLIYSWKGHVQVGNFDVAPYEYNTKMLNAVSSKFSKKQVEDKKVAKGNFTFDLGSKVASYTDGEIKHEVDRFSVTYENHRITNYSCNYNIIIAEANVRINLNYSGTFDYTYIH